MVNILIHGLGQNETSWNEVKNQLNNSEINVETPNLFSIVKNYQVNYENMYKTFADYCNSFNEKIMELNEVSDLVTEKLNFPMFVKPSNSGSSVGISKASNLEELKNAIVEASKFDKKILIEQGIDGREVECAVLGNEDVVSSCVGEIIAADEFYSYDAKYKNQESKTLIPAEISDDKSEEIRKLAIKAFKSIDGKGLSRVDFFIENGTGKVYINEINTLPGFTSISMYPKLFEQVGVEYSELLDRVIDLAFRR